VHRIPLLAACCLSVLAAPAAAEEAAAPEHSVAAEHEGAGEAEAWREHRSYLTGFAGVTIEKAEPAAGEPAAGEPAADTWETAPTLGFDYSFRVTRWLAAGAYVDFAGGPVVESLVGPCLFVFPWRGLFLEVSPSLSVKHSGELGFVARGALGYEFEVTETFALGLYAAADWSPAGVAVVPGVTAGWAVF